MLKPVGATIVSITDRIRVRANSEPDPAFLDVTTAELRERLEVQRELLGLIEHDQSMREQFIQRADAELARRGVVL